MTIAARTILEAAERGDAERVRALLSADAALANVRGDYHKTPLHWAAEKNHVVVADALLAAGAALEAETTWGMTPLAWAANMGSREVGALLHGRGARLTMWAAAGLGWLDVVASYWNGPRALKPGAGQARNRRDAEGKWVRADPPSDYADLVSDAFYLACRNGHTRVAEFLLARGARVDQPGFFGGTGLHWAAINGHRETVEFLLAHGADTARRDTEFAATPIGWAREGGHRAIEELLRRAGGMEESSSR